MEKCLDALPLLVIPFFACLVIASLHCYMGLHVIKRGVIFVDLALAQCAALGAAVALLISPYVGQGPHHDHSEAVAFPITEARLADGLEIENNEQAAQAEPSADESHDVEAHADHVGDEHAWLTYVLSVGFAVLGAVLLSLARLRDEHIPHEAIIGILFVVCAAVSVLILSKAPHGHEKMEAMFVGSILFVSRRKVVEMLLLYAGLGAFHLLFRRRFIEISKNVAAADRAGVRVKLWDCLFYGTFALMVTQSVSIAGVFVVFSFLIIPAACATLFANRFGPQLVIAWGIALLAVLGGLFLSAAADMPTGSSLVSCLGATLVLCGLVRKGLRGHRAGA